MKIVDIRKLTFKTRKYKCNLTKSKKLELINNGFFYTLLGTNTQCAFCRIIIGGWNENVDINKKHKKLSPNCEIFNNENIIFGKLVINDKIIESKKDEDRGLCKICFISEVQTMFNCGHVVSCIECTKRCNICPVCRCNSYGWKRIYLT